MLFILIGARVFSLTFYGVNGHIWVEHLLTSLPGGEIGFLIGVNILVFLLAFFLDFFELAFIIVPLLAPAADKLGIDLIWFGVLLGVNMQTSFMHPPFGFALFYLRSVAARVPYLDRITGKTDRAGDHRPDLLGRGALRLHPGDHGRPDHRLPADGDALQGHGGRSGHDRSTRCRKRRACRRSARRRRMAARRRPRLHRTCRSRRVSVKRRLPSRQRQRPICPNHRVSIDAGGSTDMKAVRLEGVGSIALREIGKPSAGPDDLLVRIEACGVCGTDRHLFHGEFPCTPPVTLGHEFSGIVEAIGTAVSGFSVGDRVTGDPNIACGRCPHCHAGRINLCQ